MCSVGGTASPEWHEGFPEGMLKPGMVFESADGTPGERPPTRTKPEDRSGGEKVG